MKYVALLRGVNVGGANLISMAGLKQHAEEIGLKNVRTYINSGNLLFETDRRDTERIAALIEEHMQHNYSANVRVVIIDEHQYRRIFEGAPKGWGEKPGWKYNTVFLIPPYSVDEILADIGAIKPDIEILEEGEGVLYQAVEFAKFGRSTTGKIASRSSYKYMTLRNWNTTRKLAKLLDE